MLILDFDLHHGNGTAAIFAADPSVLFVDTHEEGSVYPSPPYAGAAADDVGEGAGAGTIINVPLPREPGGGALGRWDWDQGQERCGWGGIGARERFSWQGALLSRRLPWCWCKADLWRR